MPPFADTWLAWVPYGVVILFPLLGAFGIYLGIRYDPWRALARRYAAPQPPAGTVFRRCRGEFGHGGKDYCTLDVTVSEAGVYVAHTHSYQRSSLRRPLLLPWTGMQSAVLEPVFLSKPRLTLVFLEGTVACWLHLPADALAAVREAAGSHFAALDGKDLFAR